MASQQTFQPIEERIVIDRLAVITFDEPVNEIEFRKYLIRNWKALTLGNSTYNMNSPFYAVQKALKVDIFNVNSNEVDER